MGVIDKQSILQLLNEADIEGLLAVGAPADEYETEAEDIFQALQAIQPKNLSADAILAVVVSVWANSFGLDESAIRQRHDAFRNIIRLILKAK